MSLVPIGEVVRDFFVGSLAKGNNMKIQYYPSKPYSWLQWPVSLRTCPRQLHITAKFFGETNLDPMAIKKRIDRLNRGMVISIFTWERKLWNSKDYVLEFKTYPSAMNYLHEMFDFIRDDHEPYRPHVTVPYEYWCRVDSEGLTPRGEKLTLGELELCIGTLNKGK